MPRAAVVDQTPLGSLTQPASRSAVRCEGCGSDRVTELAMTLTDGTPVRMRSCRACEHRSWLTVGEDGEPVRSLAIAQVLDRTRKPR